MDIKQEIINAINIIVDRRIQSLSNNDVLAMIMEVDSTRDRYKVKINGIDKWVKDGVGISPTVGQSVWIRIPNGQIKDAYIQARR